MFSLVSFAGMTLDKWAVLRIGNIVFHFHLKVNRKRGGLVHWPLALDVMGSIPATGVEKFRS